MNNNFQESGINFCFQPDWLVFKYDEHLAHKKVDKCLKPTLQPAVFKIPHQS